jgi:hypothetical protein
VYIKLAKYFMTLFQLLTLYNSNIVYLNKGRVNTNAEENGDVNVFSWYFLEEVEERLW